MPWLTSLYNPANMRYALRIAPTYPPPCSCKMILSRFAFSFDSKSSMVKCSISIVCMVKHSGHFHGGSAVPICLRSSPFFIFFPISKSFVVCAIRLSRGYSPHFLSFTVPLFYFPLSENSCAAGQQNSRVSGHEIFAAVPFLLSGLL